MTLKGIDCPVYGKREFDECQECASSHLAPCGCSSAYINLVIRGSEGRAPGLHVSNIIGCPVKYKYDQACDVYESPYSYRAMSLGTANHLLLQTFKPEGLIAEMPLSWTVAGKTFVGTCDAYDPERHTVIDYKTPNRIAPKYLPYSSNEMQLRVYAYMLRMMGHPADKAVISYMSATEPLKCKKCQYPITSIVYADLTYECPRCGTYAQSSPPFTNIEVELWDNSTVEEYIKSQLQLIEDGARTSNEWMCNYCPHREVCMP